MEQNEQGESLKMEQFIGAQTAQTLVEGEVALPGGLREEAKVLAASAFLVTSDGETLNDRVAARGKVTFHVLYTQGDPTVLRTLEAGADFAHTLPVSGALPRMSAAMQGTLEHAEAAAANGRLVLKAVVRLRTQVFDLVSPSVLTAPEDKAHTEVMTEQVTLNKTQQAGHFSQLLREEFELSDALKVQDTLFATAQPRVQEVTGGEKKVNVTGEIEMEVYHASDMEQHPLVVTRHTFPFEVEVPIAIEQAQQITVVPTVEDVAVLSQTDKEDGRVLRAEVLLAVNAFALDQTQLVLLKDAYTTSGPCLALTNCRLAVKTEESMDTSAESGRMVLLLSEGAKPVRTPLAGFMVPVAATITQGAGKCTVDGVMETTLVYRTDDQAAVETVSLTEPFRMTFACPCGAEDLYTLTASNVDVNALTSDRVEMKYILHLAYRHTVSQETDFVTGAEQQEAPPAAPGLIVYYPDPGETAWDVGKKYRVGQETLAKMNPDGLTGGALVWRRQRE